MLLTVQGVRVTAIISAYNEADIIAQTVADLVRQGIAAYVIDDHSTDGRSRRTGPLMTSGLVRVERSADPAGAGGFELARVLSRKEQLARELDSEWFLNHDADEFRESPWRHLDLRQGIELVDRLGYNAIDFAVLNFWPTHDGFDGGADIREEFRYLERRGDLRSPSGQVLEEGFRHRPAIERRPRRTLRVEASVSGAVSAATFPDSQSGPRRAEGIRRTQAALCRRRA